MGETCCNYEPNTASSNLDLKERYENSALVSIDEDPDEWIMEFENLQAQIDDIKCSSLMTNRDFLVHVLKNLPEEYDIVLDGL